MDALIDHIFLLMSRVYRQ